MTASITNSRSLAQSREQMQEKSILERFLFKLNYTPLEIDPTNVELEAFMRYEVESRNIQCSQFERTLHLAASLVELSYHHCTLEEKKNIALYTWYLIYVDDVLPSTVALKEFAQRFLRGQPQLNPVLAALVGVLMNMWDMYDPLSANTIVVSTLEYITFTCIEPKMGTMPLAEGIRRFPQFIREKSGDAAAFALQTYPKSRSFTIMETLQALPDMCCWINLVNDLLSFHKEELAGEKGNYVHIRANMENLTPLEVLANMAEELLISRDTIHAALAQDPGALAIWKLSEQGYVLVHIIVLELDNVAQTDFLSLFPSEWHLKLDRYRLSDLDL
ncbi:isoprenoid synthase domain-containing protein [Hysterangium stoloniferum]|nr:isoprenoid synthase domain-containing protein [Hysterangium stoloniferum]